MGDLSYFISENDTFYIPDSIGSDSNTEQIASNLLKREGLMSDLQSSNLVGFWFPEEKGLYKSRIYFNEEPWFDSIQSPKIVVVYYEERDNLIFTWTKLVDIEF